MSNENARARLLSIDAVRGIAVLLMILDHAREFLATSGFAPTDPDRSYLALYVTRWITHFCAPAFVLLAGVSPRISIQRGTRSLREMRNFLLLRGAWLILIECTLVSLAWDIRFREINLQVIWAIGVSMLALALFVQFHPRVSLIVGLIVLFSHNLLADVPTAGWPHWLQKVWLVLYGQGVLWQPSAHLEVQVTYPVIPWIGVILIGYGVSDALLSGLQKRSVAVFFAGVAALLLFVVLRYVDVYGEPMPWHVFDGSMLQTLMSFFNLTKYPPSLDFLLCMLGLVLVALYWATSFPEWLARFCVTYGAVPFFVYVTHLFILQGLMWICIVWHHFGLPGSDVISIEVMTADERGRLWLVYGAAVIAIALLKKPCERFAVVKRTNRSPWLSFL